MTLTCKDVTGLTYIRMLERECDMPVLVGGKVLPLPNLVNVIVVENRDRDTSRDSELSLSVRLVEDCLNT